MAHIPVYTDFKPVMAGTIMAVSADAIHSAKRTKMHSGTP